jgi:hypothetical protein
MFKTSSENNHYLRSQRLLALVEVAKVTSKVLLESPNIRISDKAFTEGDMENAHDVYRSAIQDIKHILNTTD